MKYVTFNDIVLCKNFLNDDITTYTEYINISDRVSRYKCKRKYYCKKTKERIEKQKFKNTVIKGEDGKYYRITIIF